MHMDLAFPFEFPFHKISILSLSFNKDIFFSSRHAHKSTVIQIKWNQNGNWLLTASRDHLLKLFDIRMMKEMQTFRGHKREATGNNTLYLCMCLLKQSRTSYKINVTNTCEKKYTKV